MRDFIGLVNYYRDMWSKRSHLLHPLTELTLNRLKFKWAYAEQKAFDEIKCIVARYTLLAYPDLNKRFDIHMNARNYQLVAVIIQYVNPITFYRRKLTVPQTGYTVTENELLNIVENLMEFCTILRGQKLNIYRL